MPSSVWLCAFRPFFLLTGLSAMLMMTRWLIGLFGWGPWPFSVGGPVVWHAHELLFGFAMASIVGFLLTAVPEFTGAPSISQQRLRALTGLWLAGRCAFALSGWTGVWVAALCDLGLLICLMASIAGPLWRQAGHPHLAFMHALALLTVVHAGFYFALWRGADPMAWLRLAIAALMVLIVVAMSRISMRLVNDALAAQRGETRVYLARPPRRHLAVLTIVAHAVGEFFLPTHLATAWLALAAAAALLNLLNDWHVGAALWRRWALIPYLGYWCMALGFAVIGVGRLQGLSLDSAGEHLQLVGALGIAVCMVMAVAGRLHGGWTLDERPWLPWAITALLCAAMARASASLPAMVEYSVQLWAVAGIAWLFAWWVYLWASWVVLSGPRPDGDKGCDESAAPAALSGP